MMYFSFKVPMRLLAFCVEANSQFPRVHPHTFGGPNCNEEGIFQISVVPNSSRENHYDFPNLKIRHTRCSEVSNNLSNRKRHNIDPFQRGFDHISKPR